jgi:DNA-binding transcriptional MerR regulator
MKNNAMVSIGEAAKQCGMSVRRVRYLSDQGYIQEPFKSVSGDVCYRLYGGDHIEQIRRIKALQDEGYTLKMAVQKASRQRSK